MGQYKLTKPSYLNDRYFSEGSTVEWDGPPNKAMVAVDEDGKTAAAAKSGPPAHQPMASEVPQPGGDAPNPIWAPEPRPAFSVKTTREPDSKRGPGRPKSTDKEASVVRNPASAGKS